MGIIDAAVGYGYSDIGIILAAANLGTLLIRVRVSIHLSQQLFHKISANI